MGVPTTLRVMYTVVSRSNIRMSPGVPSHTLESDTSLYKKYTYLRMLQAKVNLASDVSPNEHL